MWSREITWSSSVSSVIRSSCLVWLCWSLTSNSWLAWWAELSSLRRSERTLRVSEWRVSIASFLAVTSANNKWLVLNLSASTCCSIIPNELACWDSSLFNFLYLNHIWRITIQKVYSTHLTSDAIRYQSQKYSFQSSHILARNYTLHHQVLLTVSFPGYLSL